MSAYLSISDMVLLRRERRQGSKTEVPLLDCDVGFLPLKAGIAPFMRTRPQSMIKKKLART
jgi:hypothetical protein